MISNIIFIVLLIAGAYCAFKISAADFSRRIIPDVYLFPLILIGLLIVAFFPWFINMGESAIAGAFGYGLGAVIGFIFERFKKTSNDYPPIGMGDIKLLAVGGIWLGMTGLAIAIIFSCLFGWIWGHYKKQKFIPFAPFFFAGSFIALIAMSFLI